MSRGTWLNGLGMTGLLLAVSQVPVMAEDDLRVVPVARPVATQMVIPMQQPYCYKKPGCCGIYRWNGSWGPGNYWALRPLFSHRTPYVRPE